MQILNCGIEKNNEKPVLRKGELHLWFFENMNAENPFWRRRQIEGLLGDYCGRQVHRKQIYGQKPVWDGFYKNAAVSLSVSKNWMLAGISLDNSVGIDFEFWQPDFQFADISSCFLTHREQQCLENLHREERYSLFSRFWTCREAVLKKEGCGLAGWMMIEQLRQQTFCRSHQRKGFGTVAWATRVKPEAVLLYSRSDRSEPYDISGLLAS